MSLEGKNAEYTYLILIKALLYNAKGKNDEKKIRGEEEAIKT